MTDQRPLLIKANKSLHKEWPLLEVWPYLSNLKDIVEISLSLRVIA